MVRSPAEVVRLFPGPDVPGRDGAPRRFAEAVRIAEALLFATAGPLAEAEIARRLPPGIECAAVLAKVQQDFAGRGVQLVRVAGKWALRTADDLGWLLSDAARETRRLSRAATETLAIIAYHQPATRAEIEEIRGVAVARGTLDLLIELDWVRPRGRRRAPGRPVIYATTEGFLLHFGFETLADLPGLDELRGAGLFDERHYPPLAGARPGDEIEGPEPEEAEPGYEADEADDDLPNAP